MKKLFSVFRLLIILSCVTTLHSCLKEDLSDCPEQSKVRIVVRTIDELARAAGDNTIENMVLYIFDQNDVLVDSWHGHAYTYGQVYETWLDLDPGIYRFVVWTNQGSTYAMGGQKSPDEELMAEDLVIAIYYPSDGRIDYDIPDLHHGLLTDAEVLAGEDNEFTITLIPNTYRLNFTVEGLAASDDDYSFTVRDNNSHYAYDNSILAGQNEFEYVRTANFTEDELTASMKVLRLTSDRSPAFELSNSTANELIYGAGLIEMIVNAYDSAGRKVDFDQEFEFNIKLKFEGMDVSVSVNGWTYYPNGTQLG